MSGGRDNPWTTLESSEIYDNAWIKVREHRVLKPNGAPGIYGTVHYKHRAVGVAPIDERGRICLVGQFRYPHAKYSWEIPEGGGWLDEDPRDAAIRELREETGVEARRWLEVLRLDLSNSVSDESAVCYLAWDLDHSAPAPEDTEVLELRWLAFTDALALALDGEITDAISVATLLRIDHMRLKRKLPPALAAAMA
ncbi:MAG TPA: NUDIX hydrolase [Alphaproteobacteria bacterium]|nr:NUDIX hydrolase [Alphaproteobacteria bacterium]